MSSFSLDYNPYMALSQAFSSRNVTTHLPNVKKATDLIARENSKLKWAHSLLIILYYYYDRKGTDHRKVSASSVETSDRYEVKTKKTLNSWWASPVIFWGKRFVRFFFYFPWKVLQLARHWRFESQTLLRKEIIVRIFINNALVTIRVLFVSKMKVDLE